MMKKFFFSSPLTAAILAALTFAACSDSDTIADGNSVKNGAVSDGSVQFSTYMGTNAQETRSGATGVITTDVLKLGNYGFGVMAYNTGTDTWAGQGASTLPNFMYNEAIKWDAANNAWTYSPVKFWPNNSANYVDETGATNSANANKLSFFAYAPYVELDYTTKTPVEVDPTADTPENKNCFVPTDQTKGIVAITPNDLEGDPSVKYILTGNAASTEAVDLLWGKRGNTAGYDLANGATEATIGEYNTDLTKQTVNEKVNFLFKHALAKIGGHVSSTSNTSNPGTPLTGLQVILDIDDGSYNGGVKNATKITGITGGEKEDVTLVTVKSVKIRDLYTYRKETAETTDDEKSDLANGGWFDFATGTWSNVYNNANKDQAASNVTYNSGKTTTTSSGSTGTLNADIAEPTSTPTYSSGWPLKGVTTTAQDVYTADSDVPAVFMIPSTAPQTLVVTIDYIVRTYDKKLASKYTEIDQVITNTVTIPGNSLDVNKYYKLLMHLGLTSIKFTATVADWDEAAPSTTTNTDGTDDDSSKDANKSIYLPSNTLSRELAATEEANAQVDITATNPTVNVPSSTTGTYKIALMNIPSTGKPQTITASSSSTNVTSPTITNNGVLNVTLAANTTTNEVANTVTISVNGTDYTLTINQTMEMNLTPITIDAGATTTATLTSTVNGTAVSTNLTTTATGYNITGNTLTVPANTSSMNKTYTIPVTYKDANDKTVTENVIITHNAGLVSVTYDPTADGTTTTNLSAGNARTITATVKDASNADINLTAATNTSTIKVTNTTDSSNPVDVTAGSVITKTTTGFTVQVPVNGKDTAQKYKITVKVNDADEVESGEFTQAAAN